MGKEGMKGARRKALKWHGRSRALAVNEHQELPVEAQ